MGKQASKTLIGAFVIGAIALIVAGVVVFGSGKLFASTSKFVMFFEGSVKGLDVGAPVIFQGVKIGEVVRIRLDFNPKDLTLVIPVYIEIDPRLLNVPKELRSLLEEASKSKKAPLMLALIEKRGLRAQLQLQSFVTGQLMVNLDFYPDKPIRLLGLEKKYPEIPTIPTGFQELTKKLEELPLKEITANLNSSLAGINKLVNSPDLQASLGSLNQLLKDADKLVKNIDIQAEPLVSNLKGTSDAARSAFVQAEKTLALKEGVPGEIGEGFVKTLTAARLTLDETQKAVGNLDVIAVQNANLGYELAETLEQIADLSRSFRVLADYLERNPQALIRGKSPSKGE